MVTDAGSQGKLVSERSRLGEERVPCGAGGVDDSRVTGAEQPVAEPAVAQVLPGSLDGLVMVPL